MRRIAVDAAPDGAPLGRDVHVCAIDPVPLLRAGSPMRDGYRDALRRAGVTHIWIEDELSRAIAPTSVIPRALRARAIAAVSEVLACAYRAASHHTTVALEDITALTPTAGALVAEIGRREPVPPSLGEPATAGEYLPAHSVDVAALGLLLAAEHQRAYGWVDPGTGARRHDLDVAGLRRLGLALLLIDLGKAAVPRGLLEHPGPVDTPGRLTLHRHAELGAALLPPGLPFVTQAVLRHHHERWDGTGYPAGIAGEAIAWEARLAAIADVFDATTSDRVYASAAPLHEGWSTIIDAAGTHFDPDLVAVFQRVIVPFPAGTEVQLADGRLAIVARVDARDPLRPTVRVVDAEGAVRELHDAPVHAPPGAGSAPLAA